MIGPNVALFDTLPDTGLVVKISLVGVPAVMASCWVADVSPVAAAVRVGVPGVSSP